MTPYESAEQQAIDSARLADILANASPDLRLEICEHLAAAFASYADETISREETVVACCRSIMHIHAIVVERVLLPKLEASNAVQT